MTDDEKTKLAMAACEAMAETWAEEIGLDAMMDKITKCSRSKKHIRELMIMSHMEGLYRGRTSVVST